MAHIRNTSRVYLLTFSQFWLTFLQDSSIFESYTLDHLNTAVDSQKLLSFVVNKRVSSRGVTNYQILAFYTTYVGLLASGQAVSYNTSLYFCVINYILILNLLIILAMMLVVQQAFSKGWPAHLAQMRTSDCLLSRLMVPSSRLITRSRWSKCLHFVWKCEALGIFCVWRSHGFCGFST